METSLNDLVNFDRTYYFAQAHRVFQKFLRIMFSNIVCIECYIQIPIGTIILTISFNRMDEYTNLCFGYIFKTFPRINHITINWKT